LRTLPTFESGTSGITVMSVGARYPEDT
jgi:hypothetical protein